MKLFSPLQIRLAPLPGLVEGGKHLDGRHQLERGQGPELNPGDANLLEVAVENLTNSGSSAAA